MPTFTPGQSAASYLAALNALANNGSMAVIDAPQTFTALQTFSAGLTVSGGSLTAGAISGTTGAFSGTVTGAVGAASSWLHVLNTSDAADSSYMGFSGGGALAATRGAGLVLVGNEHATLPGIAYLAAGNVTGGIVQLKTGNGIVGLELSRGSGGTVAGEVTIPGTLGVTQSVSMTEMTAPAGVANTAKLFAVDNGAGKTVLKVIFGSGAAQVISTEP